MTDLMLGKDGDELIVVNTPIRIKCNGPKDWIVYIRIGEGQIWTINVTATSKEEAKTAAEQYINERLKP